MEPCEQGPGRRVKTEQDLGTRVQIQDGGGRRKKRGMGKLLREFAFKDRGAVSPDPTAPKFRPFEVHGRDATDHPGKAAPSATYRSGPSSYFGSPALLLRRADRAPGGYCRCTRNRGASVHLLEGPTAAHLHRHVKIFINTPRAQDPRGGASREEVQDTIGEGSPRTLSERHHPTKDSSASFSTKEPAPSKGETWPIPLQAAPHHQKGAACKGATASAFSSSIFAPRVDPTPPFWGHEGLLLLQ